MKYIYENQVLQDIPPEQRIGGTPDAGLRPQFINPVECKNVLFEGFTISTPGPFWTFDITYCENITMEDLRHEVIWIDTNYGAYMASENGKAYPVFRNLSFRNITCNNAGEAINMQGTSHTPIENVTLENLDISASKGMNLNWVNGLTVKNVKYRQVDNSAIIPGVLFTRSHGEGLEAAYFNNKELKGKPAFTRIDKNIDFNWWAGNKPAPGLGHDQFSIRWKGMRFS